MFDSFLIPLIRTNFYVTESNAHRNRIFYFRHDVWRILAEPWLANIKLSMFEEMPIDRATKLLSARNLGFSKIRLLPKTVGARVITNLRRRQPVMRNGTMMLGRSINSVLTPLFNAITYEKVSCQILIEPELLFMEIDIAIRTLRIIIILRNRLVPKISTIPDISTRARPRQQEALLCKGRCPIVF